ncbi:hypothetical protein TorRG33x02_000410 [Trema orientale]|uniref:Uncharacterized protein n=1 Tax=Trema orientale TaxID=63057 RepID=A0A2P5G138_TREOI|nr:hypothetical protein TorRG33x02_000410 [Trema orientale]
MNSNMLLSPSTLWRSKTCLANRLEIVDESVEPVGSRNARRSRRQPEMEVREEKDLGLVEDIGKPRKSTTSCGLRRRS